MPINKVVFGQTTLIDLTGDTVTEATLLTGVTAHKADGSKITGTAIIPSGEEDRLVFAVILEDSSRRPVLDSSDENIICNRVYLPV